MSTSTDLEDTIVGAGLLKLKQLQSQCDELQRQIDLLLKDVQASCRHPVDEVIEGWTSSDWSSRAPVRVCKVCGYNEPGWNCGYHLLQDPPNPRYRIPTVSEEEARRYVRGGLMTQEEKISRMDLISMRRAAKKGMEEVFEEVKRESDRLDAVNDSIAEGNR